MRDLRQAEKVPHRGGVPELLQEDRLAADNREAETGGEKGCGE